MLYRRASLRGAAAFYYFRSLKGIAIHATRTTTRVARTNIVGEGAGFRRRLLLHRRDPDRAAPWIHLLANDGCIPRRIGAGLAGARCGLPGHFCGDSGDSDALRS